METLTFGIEILGAVALAVAFIVGILFKRYEVAVGVLLLAGGTYWHALQVDRWGEPGSDEAELRARLAQVPIVLGDWEGTDMPVEDEVKEVAGAVGHINRIYKNSKTGDEINIWVAAGHAAEICRHTPNICFPSQGYSQEDPEIHFNFPIEGEHKSEFWTANFTADLGDHRSTRKRVFWAWSGKHSDGELGEWLAPNKARSVYRNQRNLYKLYFTTIELDKKSTADMSPSVEFAKLFIPVVNNAITGELSPGAKASLAEEQAEGDQPVVEDETST